MLTLKELILKDIQIYLVKIIQDQKKAREHATKWDTHIKKQLLDTLTGIVEYDTTFDNYYDTLVKSN